MGRYKIKSGNNNKVLIKLSFLKWRDIIDYFVVRNKENILFFTVIGFYFLYL